MVEATLDQPKPTTVWGRILSENNTCKKNLRFFDVEEFRKFKKKAMIATQLNRQWGAAKDAKQRSNFATIYPEKHFHRTMHPK